MHQSHFQCFKVIQNAKYLQLYSNPKHSCLSRVPLSFSCLSCTYPRRRLELLDACGRFSLTLQTDRTHITQVLSQITRSPSFFHSTEQTYLGELQWSSKVLISAWPCSSGSDSTLYAWLAIYKFWDLLVETCFNCGVTHCASWGLVNLDQFMFPERMAGRKKLYNCQISHASGYQGQNYSITFSCSRRGSPGFATRLEWCCECHSTQSLMASLRSSGRSS